MKQLPLHDYIGYGHSLGELHAFFKLLPKKRKAIIIGKVTSLFHYKKNFVNIIFRLCSNHIIAARNDPLATASLLPAAY
jgi:hypothetical protein